MISSTCSKEIRALIVSGERGIKSKVGLRLRKLGGGAIVRENGKRYL